MKTKRLLQGMAVAGAIVLGSIAAPAPATAPAEAFDSRWSLCAGLWQKSARTTCFANNIRGTYMTRAELRCYKKAGVAISASIASTLITTRDARIIASVAGVAGVFACIDTFV